MSMIPVLLMLLLSKKGARTFLCANPKALKLTMQLQEESGSRSTSQAYETRHGVPP